MSDNERHALRQGKANPVLDKIKCWLEQHLYQTTPDSKIGRAIKYTLGNWNERSGYLKDWKLEIDNNLAENKIRLLALGRKNFLFSGNHAAAQNAAMMYQANGWKQHWKGFRTVNLKMIIVDCYPRIL
jgi:transposase